MLYVGVWLALLFVIVPATELVFDHTFYRWHYRRQRNAGRPIRFVLADDALTWTVEGMEGRIDWAAVRRILATETVLIAYVDDTAGIPVPRGSLSDEDWCRTMASVLERVGATTKVDDRRGSSRRHGRGR